MEPSLSFWIRVSSMLFSWASVSASPAFGDARWLRSTAFSALTGCAVFLDSTAVFTATNDDAS